jgi:putative addiction module component (TIGR02574 family)
MICYRELAYACVVSLEWRLIMDLTATLTEIRAMSMDDRIRLVQAILESITEDQAQLELTEAQRQELDRRLADMDANPDDEILWEQAYAESLRRVQQ